MVDDNEIRRVVRNTSERFLDEARKATHKEGQVFDIATEFARTRKNRSSLVVWVTIATIAGLGLTAFAATAIIRNQAAAMPVDVKPFDDLNLSDLLDTAKKSDSDLEQAKLDLSRLQSAERTGLAAIDQELAATLEAITARYHSRAEVNKRKAQAQAQADAQKKALRDRFAGQIAAAKAHVASIQATIDGFDRRFSEQTRKQQELLDSQSRLFDLEKQRLIATYAGRLEDLEAALEKEQKNAKRQRDALAASYTARWNPVFEDTASLSLLTGFTLQEEAPQPIAKLPASVFDAGILGTRDANGIDASFGNLLLLSGKLREIPYENSVPPALARIEYEARFEYLAFRAALERSGKAIADEKARTAKAETALDGYDWALAQFLADGKQDGCLVDCRDRERMTVVLSASVKVTADSQADVTRPGPTAGSTQVIGRVAFFQQDGRTFAKVVSLADGERLRALDILAMAK